jgi:hypothetical protein
VHAAPPSWAGIRKPSQKRSVDANDFVSLRLRRWPTRPLSPYGTAKQMSENMLHDTTSAQALNYVVLRYFNVAGADPQARIGLATLGATHLLMIAVEAATASPAGELSCGIKSWPVRASPAARRVQHFEVRSRPAGR